MLGILTALGKGLGAIGGIGGGQQSGANNARVAQGQLDLARDRNALDRYGQQQGAQFSAGQLDLQRKDHALDSRNRNAKSMLIASLLNGGLPSTSVAGGKQSGGLVEKFRTDPGAMTAMRNLTEQSDKAQMAPMDWSQALNFQGGQVLDAPQLSDPQKLDIKGSDLMRVLQMIGGIAGIGGGGGGE